MKNFQKNIKTDRLGKHRCHRRGHDGADLFLIIPACGNHLVAQVTVGDNTDNGLVIIWFMDKQGTDPVVGHGLGRLLDGGGGRHLAGRIFNDIAHLHGEEVELLIAAPPHAVPAQFGIGGVNDFFGKTFQVILGKTGLVLDKIKKNLPGQKKAEGILHHLNIQVCRGAVDNRQSTDGSSLAAVILQRHLALVIGKKGFHPAPRPIRPPA